MENEFMKDPDGVLDYTFDWSNWLETGDTVVSHTISIPTGLTLGEHINNTTAVTIWLSSGTIGGRYKVECTVTTSQGRTDTRRALIMVEER